MRPYIILTLLVMVAYANSVQNQFVWDDGMLIVNNPKINLSIKEMPSILATPMWKITDFTEGIQLYYRPLVSLLFVLNYKIWGLNPSGFHMTNIILHLISTIILYRIGLLLFNKDILIALIGASIFAVHPVNNEPVGRAACGEVIFGFFIILTIYLFLKEKKYLSYFTFFLALLSKETAVMLPFALVVISIHKNLSCYALKREGLKNGIIEIIPYILLIGIYLILRAMFVDTVLGGGITQPIFTLVFTRAAAAFDYIRLLLIPYPLSPFYPARWHTSIFEPKVMIAIIVLLLISFLAFKIRKDRIMLFLLTFPFIMLVPVIWRVNAFMAGSDNLYIAERYLYVPSMLFSLFESAFFVKLFKDIAKGYLVTGWIFIVIVFTVISTFANMVWKNDIILLQRVVNESPNVIFGHYNLGIAYYEQGQFDEAIKEYLAILKINPNMAQAHHNLGLAYSKQGQFDKAINEYNAAIKINPNHALAHNSLGTLYFELSLLNEAIKEYLTALELKPEYREIPKIHYNIGIAYYNQGRLNEARKEFETALKLKPDFTPAKEAIEKLGDN